MSCSGGSAGNGRAFYDPPVAGIQWGRGAVGTARWKGARLKDVLTRAGITPAGRFVLVSGADRPLGTMPEFEFAGPGVKVASVIDGTQSVANARSPRDLRSAGRDLPDACDTRR